MTAASRYVQQFEIEGMIIAEENRRQRGLSREEIVALGYEWEAREISKAEELFQYELKRARDDLERRKEEIRRKRQNWEEAFRMLYPKA